MGLEMLQLQNRVLEKVNINRLEETNARLGVGLAAMFMYMLIGAIIFCRIEAPIERFEKETYREFRQQWEKILNERGISSSDVDRLFANIRDAALNGVWEEKNETSELNWTFGSAFFFSGTLLTTVGYGHVSPRTTHGKLFTVIYCMVGIPLTLSLLSALAVRLRWPSQWLRTKMNMKLGGVFHGKHLQLIHLGFITTLVLIVAFIIPSWIFMSIEDDWTFIDSFYYCFVSLTTIGLGDYIPGDKPDQPLRSFYKIAITIYLVLGLCCMMLFLATLYDVPQFNIVKYFVTKSEAEDENEIKPIHMNSGNTKYERYDDVETPNHIVNPFAINGYYQ
ncbi:unnamed protein product [Bursaphelenchus xylophilus]|uniref:Two pore potassium channel protein sup-9 n=1 Tax=Bursaphelenchus xylophilus TaxID=6326 RepID=A0A1I7RSM7_BURXY|nr:unnamed protein product [Bursaphelenchus xylophilus]CAG9122866.1 unnamed protein product [Bursaphelenchus xylophilus]